MKNKTTSWFRVVARKKYPKGQTINEKKQYPFPGDIPLAAPFSPHATSSWEKKNEKNTNRSWLKLRHHPNLDTKEVTYSLHCSDQQALQMWHHRMLLLPEEKTDICITQCIWILLGNFQFVFIYYIFI